MSLLRPEWLDDLIKPAPAASPRLRGLKGFGPQEVAAFQDPLYADDPQFWELESGTVGVAANFSKVGVQTPLDDSLIAIVDGVIVCSDVLNDITVDVIQGGTLLLALTTDTNVFKKNRREQSTRSGVVERVGLLRIADNANAFTGTSIAHVRAVGNTPIAIPLGHRLFGSEQLFARANVVNTLLTATMYGRVTTRGQR